MMSYVAYEGLPNQSLSSSFTVMLFYHAVQMWFTQQTSVHFSAVLLFFRVDDLLMAIFKAVLATK